MKYKLGLIIPYRDRFEQLEIFKRYIFKYLTDKGFDFEIIIVEQDNAKLFNRGMLLNIGFKYAVERGCNYVVFHDVDMLPIDVDYSYSKVPLHLATKFEPNSDITRTIFDTYFGGVTLFPVEDFNKINGYSNKYWGWGYEDDDLLHRCEKNDIILDELYIKNQSNMSKCLKFNGVNAYVKCKNTININRGKTIFVSFYPENLVCDHNKPTDTYSIFSIPGYDFSISYNSFSRYNFCCFDGKKNVLYVNSNIKTNYRTTMCVVFDRYNKKISVYQDGELIGTIIMENPLMNYIQQEYFYLGVGNPNREDTPNYFKGYIDKFIVINDILTNEDVKTLPNNLSKDVIELYYDAKRIENYKLVDLSGNKNFGEIINCEITGLEPEENKVIKIPYRRHSLFKLLPHEDNGFLNNRWKTDFTRWNQLRFVNEVLKNDELLYNDGLSDLLYMIHEKNINENVTKLNVGLCRTN